jgi:hypothetical protein
MRPGVAAMIIAVEGEIETEDISFANFGRTLGDKGGMRLAFAAVEGSVAGAAREFAGELVAADALASGQIREGSLPANGFRAAGADIAYGAEEGQGYGRADRQQDGVKEA